MVDLANIDKLPLFVDTPEKIEALAWRYGVEPEEIRHLVNGSARQQRLLLRCWKRDLLRIPKLSPASRDFLFSFRRPDPDLDLDFDEVRERTKVALFPIYSVMHMGSSEGNVVGIRILAADQGEADRLFGDFIETGRFLVLHDDEPPPTPILL